MKYLVYLSALLLVSSCAYQTGSVQNSVVLTNADYTVTGTAFASASSYRLLGFGGFQSKGLAAEAKRKLYSNYQLAENEVLANFTVDQTFANYWIFDKITVFLTADIVKLNEKDPTSDFNSNTVLYYDPDSDDYKGAIKKVFVMESNSGKSKLIYFDEKQNIKSFSASDTTLYNWQPGVQPALPPLRVGDIFMLEKIPLDQMGLYYYNAEVKLIGFNKERLLLEVLKGNTYLKYYSIPYNDIGEIIQP